MPRTVEDFDKYRNAIRAQIDERNQMFPDERPGHPWDLVGMATNYLFSFPGAELRNIRLHVDLILGTELGRTLLYPHDPAALDQLSGYSWLGEGIDQDLWALEPPVPALGDRPLGTPMFGKTVNDETALVQRYMCNLLRLGLHDGQHVVEIGAGYGGLSAAVQKATNVRYTIIDLPETLLYSTCFLAEQFPDKRIYVYQPGDDASAQDGFDIVLLPNYRSEFLATCDVAINTVSFPEMRRADLDGYIDLLSDRLRPGGFLMSVNYENHVDGKTVCDHLERRFDQFPNRTEQVAIADECGMDPLHVNFRPTTVCVHKRSMPPIVELRDVIAGHRVKTDLRQSLRHDLGDDAVVVDSAAAGHRDNRLDRP